MKVIGIQRNENNPQFGTSTRVLKNTVAQLSKNNKYSLNEPNQRRIRDSIAELSRIPQKNVINFLLETAAKLKYATNIKLEDSPLNNWKEMLLNAAISALALLPFVDKTEFNQKVEQLRATEDLTGVEKDILKLREKLLNVVDIKQIEEETIGGIKDFKHNLDYFIISSETTNEHKKYVLQKLNYLMSNRYKINPQLKDKKSIVAAELVNDMAIFTPGHKIPNIKAVNQIQHGMCNAISIVRKKIAYEDKPNYIDSILSELDDSDLIEVYDRSKLGSGAKTHVMKTPVDFSAALSKGYRIIDASATQWMEIGHKSGYSGKSLNNYTSFDKENFDINTDAFYNALFEDPELKELQEYYQALVKASSIINDYKADRIKDAVILEDKQNEYDKNCRAVNDTLNDLTKTINVAFPNINTAEARKIINDLISLEKKYSNKIDSLNPFEYISNEEESVKKNKIKEYLLNQSGVNDNLIEDNLIDKVYDILNLYHSLNNELSVNSGNKYSIGRARELYKIGAGNRFQLQKGLTNETTLSYMMKKEHIPNREECLENTADILIEKLEYGSSDSDLILQSLSNNIKTKLKTPSQGIEILEQVKQELNENSKEIDKVYKSIGLNNKEDALIECIENFLIEIIENNNKALLSEIARNLEMPSDSYKVAQKLENLKNDLLKNKSNYNKVFNLLGNSSQVSFLNDMMQLFMQNMAGEDARGAIETLITENNLDINNLSEEVSRKVNEILNIINLVYERNEILTRVLRITDEKGNLIYTPDPAELIIKKFENNNTIPSSEMLQVLQEHLDRIQKERSADEFNSRQGKLKNSSLTRFSDKEKEALDAIDKNINPISRYIKKQLSYVQQYIKVPLEELNRKIGINNGEWWVTKEGHSGLSDGGGVRILEYITGRSHYVSKNLEKAIEKIKISPYSGTSSSSVYHDKPGMHAQYIADVEPVELEVKDNNGKINKEVVDVLYQDNTWGASEHENTWTDSKGMQRTDYSDKRGGTLGYITNDKYRNGNIVTRVTGDMVLHEEPDEVNSRLYKKITKQDNMLYSFPQYLDIKLDGKSPELKSIANSIYDTIFTPTSRLIDTIKKLTKDMSYEEINGKLKSIKLFKNNWKSISDVLLKRIHDNESKNAIITQEDYDKLPDTDFLKITLEKTAMLGNLYIEGVPAVITNVSELDKYRTLQKKRAIKNFEYAFAKNMDFMKYLAQSLSVDDLNKIEQYLKKYNIQIDDKEFEDIFCNFEVINDEFNGNARHTINLIVKDIFSKIKDKINSPEAETELKKLLREIFSEKIYFNQTDIANPEILHIIKFIDRVYNPESNEDLIRIYKNLQNMTVDEFKQQIIPLLNNDDLNIKSETGYGLLKRIQRYEEGAENALCNTIFADEIEKHTEKSNYNTEYTNYKLHRTPKVLAKYTFDSAYRAMKYDLSYLVLPKRFNEYKERNLYKYGAFPAYPSVDYMSDKMFKIITETFIDPIENEIEKIRTFNDLIEYYELSDSLKDFAKKYKKEDVLTDEQYKALNNILDRMGTLTCNVESQAEVYAAIMEAMGIDPGEKFKKYSKYLKFITSTIDDFKSTAPVTAINNEIESEKMLISKQSEMLIKTYIRNRYQKNVSKTLNDFKQALIKDKKDSEGYPFSEAYREKLIDEIKSFNILQEPAEVLDRYIESLAKDSPLNKFSDSIESLLKRALEFAKLCDIQSTVMDSLNDGIETDVKSAFNKVQVQLSNGSSVPMGTTEMIGYIVHELVYDNQDETALMFIDKLGLNEEYVKYVANDYFDYDETKEFIEENVAKQKRYKEYTATFNKTYEVIRDEIENGKNPIRCINKLKKTLVEAGKTYSIDKKHAKIFLDAVDNCKITWNENPTLDKVAIMNELFYAVGGIFETTVNKTFEDAFRVLESQQTVIGLMNKVPLLPKSEASKLRDETNKKFEEVVEYNNQLMNNLQQEK